MCAEYLDSRKASDDELCDILMSLLIKWDWKAKQLSEYLADLKVSPEECFQQFLIKPECDIN